MRAINHGIRPLAAAFSFRKFQGLAHSLKRVPGRAALGAVLLWLGCILLPGTAGAAENVVPVRMGLPPHGGFNRILVSVKICKPGTSQCVTVDDVMIDTGSTGLRLQASALPAGFTLPDALGPDQKPLAECLHFVSSRAWGGVVHADLTLGGMSAQKLPIQVIGDATRPRPDDCPPSASAPTSNGTLGIGIRPFDCTGACTASARMPLIYTCDALSCAPLEGSVDQAYRLPNPVTRFNVHSNGIVLEFPDAPAGGAAAVKGTLTLGVETADNNRLGSAQRLMLGPNGLFTTLYDGRTYPGSYIDSGTATYAFADDQLPTCPIKTAGYCLQPTATLDATMVGRNQATIPMTFKVGNYQTQRANNVGASDSLAVKAQPDSPAFVWGAPFFLGKRIFQLIDGQSLPTDGSVTGPLYAIAP
ncbi:DUF3443 family protein [Aureimonas frigidaquae]|uniref:DUF3443 family protein n=1 Tax=Aureimonas frigidaquae TaxID=424757 RepID=UPI000AF19E59|nr:DUF3443 family protein [Aureimonas frigidaquae]